MDFDTMEESQAACEGLTVTALFKNPAQEDAGEDRMVTVQLPDIELDDRGMPPREVLAKLLQQIQDAMNDRAPEEGSAAASVVITGFAEVADSNADDELPCNVLQLTVYFTCQLLCEVQMAVPAERKSSNVQGMDFKMINDTDFDVKHCWINFDGEDDTRTTPETLAPGEEFSRRSDTGHPHRFWRADTEEEIACFCFTGDQAQLLSKAIELCQK